jgi:glycosyltransferase involved in cell wall biosynthesis
VVVVDNYSTDDTLALAEPRIARVIMHRNAGYAEHPATVRHVLHEVTSDWIYWGRVDELPPAPLLQRLLGDCGKGRGRRCLPATVEPAVWPCGEELGARLSTGFFQAFGDECRPERAVRTLRAETRGTPIASTPRPEFSLWHFSAYDVAAYTNTNNRYSSIAVREILARPVVNPRYSTSVEGSKRVVKGLLDGCSRRGHLGFSAVF